MWDKGIKFYFTFQIWTKYFTIESSLAKDIRKLFRNLEVGGIKLISRSFWFSVHIQTIWMSAGCAHRIKSGHVSQTRKIKCWCWNYYFLPSDWRLAFQLSWVFERMFWFTIGLLNQYVHKTSSQHHLSINLKIHISKIRMQNSNSLRRNFESLKILPIWVRNSIKSFGIRQWIRME